MAFRFFAFSLLIFTAFGTSFSLPSSSTPPKRAASAATDHESSQQCHRCPVSLKVRVKPGVGPQLSQHIRGARAATGSPGAKVRWIYGVSYWHYRSWGHLGGGRWDGGLGAEGHRGQGGFLARGRREAVVSRGAGGALPDVPSEEDAVPGTHISNLIPNPVRRERAAAAGAPL